MSSSPRVFLPLKTEKYDISKAEEFGDIVFLSEDPISPFNTNEVIWKFINSLRRFDFDSDKDFICMTGNSLILCWLTISLITLYDHVNILVFDSRSDKYQEKQLEKPWMENNNE